MTGVEKKQVQSEGNGMPDWLVKQGVQPGGYQYVTKAQLRTQMRPDRPLKVQVWACGMLHTVAYQGEIAVTMRGGKRVLLRPRHIIQELHKEAIRFYKSGGIEDVKKFGELRETREAIRRVLEELEEDGLSDRKAKGASLRDLPLAERKKLRSSPIEYHFYLNPRSATPEKVRQEWDRFNPPEAPVSEPNSEEKEVGKIWLLKVSIPKFLKALEIEKPGKPILADERFLKALSDASQRAKKLIEEVVSPWLQDVPTAGPQEVATPRLPQVAIPGGAFVRKVESIVETAAAAPSLRVVEKPEKAAAAQPTSTTPTTTEDWDTVGRAAAQYGVDVTDKWQRDLVRKCQALTADVTPGEIAQLIHRMGRKTLKAEKPSGFLMHVVPELCEGESFRRLRERLRQEAQPDTRPTRNFAAQFREQWPSMSLEDRRMALEVYPELADLDEATSGEAATA